MSELLPCPFCGGEANTLHRPHVIDWRYSVGCNDDECRGFIGLSWLYKTEAEAIAAWNSRADYHGYEQAAIEAWESIKAWNSRAERTCRDTGENEWHFVCSACGYEQNGYECWNYCPNCGAKVQGEVITRFVPADLDYIENKSRWAELFGTPERAARTLARMCAIGDGSCAGCPMFKANLEHCESDYTHLKSIVEWLRGDA